LENRSPMAASPQNANQSKILKSKPPPKIQANGKIVGPDIHKDSNKVVASFEQHLIKESEKPI